jgi:hypothetical protein
LQTPASFIVHRNLLEEERVDETGRIDRWSSVNPVASDGLKKLQMMVP